MAKWLWWLNDVPANPQGIIREAKRLGYVSENGVYWAWDAAQYLRQHGEKVEQWETGE